MGALWRSFYGGLLVLGAALFCLPPARRSACPHICPDLSSTPFLPLPNSPSAPDPAPPAADCPYKHTMEAIKECNMYKLGFCIYGPAVSWVSRVDCSQRGNSWG